MFHGLTHEIIYAAARLTTVFEGRDGTQIPRQGTCFGVACPNEKLALVTNRHLVDLHYPEYQKKYCLYKLKHLICDTRGRDINNNTPGTTKRFIMSMLKNKVDFDDNDANDVAVIFNAQLENEDGTVNCCWDYCFKIEDLATEDEIRSDLHPFDFLAFTGFPAGYDKTDLKPIIRGGTVASDPRFSYQFNEKDKGEIVLYEGFSFGGSSGSPVVAIPKVPPINVDPHPSHKFRRFLMVGINAGHTTEDGGILSQHAGLSYFVKSSVIRRIIDKCAQGEK